MKGVVPAQRAGVLLGHDIYRGSRVQRKERWNLPLGTLEDRQNWRSGKATQRQLLRGGSEEKGAWVTHAAGEAVLLWAEMGDSLKAFMSTEPQGSSPQVASVQGLC